MGVGPFLAGQRALILVYTYVLEARILLEIGDARRPDPEHALDFLVRELGEIPVVSGRFNDDFVGAERAHFVVHAFGLAAKFALDAVNGRGMSRNADLPWSLGRPDEDGRLGGHGFRLEGTLGCRFGASATLSQDDPTFSDRIPSQFHRARLLASF